jgi:hypothetical protein
MAVERENWLLGIEVYSALKQKQICTIEQLTQRIYKNNLSKNIVRIYQCLMVMLKNDLVQPVVKEGILYFKTKDEKKEEKL